MDLKSFKKTRASYKSKLTIFKTYLERLLPSEKLNPLQIHELTSRLSIIQELYNNFDTTQTEIEQLTEIPDSEFKERETSYFSTVATALELLGRNSTAAPASAGHDDSSATGTNYKEEPNGAVMEGNNKSTTWSW